MDEMRQIIDEARDVQALAMIDDVVIDRSRGRVLDRVTGEETEAWERVWSGPGRAPRADASTRVIVTGETITPAQPVVIVPWDVQARPGDRVRVDGRTIWVTDASPRTYQSAVHLTCREVR